MLGLQGRQCGGMVGGYFLPQIPSFGERKQFSEPLLILRRSGDSTCLLWSICRMIGKIP